MAQDSKLKPRYVQFSSANNHIYEQNLEDIKTMVAREPSPYIPWVEFAPDKSLFDLDPETDIELKNYKPHAPIKFEVAK